jgi:hypothetical protein
MREYRFIIRLPANQALAYYQGAIDTVQAVDVEELWICFPAQGFTPTDSGGILSSLQCSCFGHFRRDGRAAEGAPLLREYGA